MKSLYYILTFSLLCMSCHVNRNRTENSNDADTIVSVAPADSGFAESPSDVDAGYDFPVFEKDHPEEFRVLNQMYRITLQMKSLDYDAVQFDSLINSYLNSKHLTFKATVDGFKQYRKCLQCFVPDNKDFRSEIEFSMQAGVKSNLEMTACYHLFKMISDLPKDVRLQESLNKENNSWKRFVDRQLAVLDTVVYGNEQFSMRSSVFGDFMTTRLERRIQSMTELFAVLTESNYKSKKQYIFISENRMNQEYARLENDIKNKKIENYMYPRKNQFQTLYSEQRAWKELMEARMQVSNLLNGNARFVYEQTTYRMQKQHLVQLKNEFDEELVVASREWANAMLKEDCDYKTLLSNTRPSDNF